MKRVLPILFICLMASLASAEDEIQWKKYSRNDIGGTVWGVSFQIPSSWKYVDKPEYSIFSNSKDCLVYPLTKWCGQRSLLLEIKKNQKGGVVKTGATEKSVSYSGAKGNIAYVGAYTFRFLTPDGKAWVKLSGKGTSLQEAKRTIRLKK